jgi:hypothetical protein
MSQFLPFTESTLFSASLKTMRSYLRKGIHQTLLLLYSYLFLNRSSNDLRNDFPTARPRSNTRLFDTDVKTLLLNFPEFGELPFRWLNFCTSASSSSASVTTPFLGGFVYGAKAIGAGSKRRFSVNCYNFHSLKVYNVAKS